MKKSGDACVYGKIIKNNGNTNVNLTNYIEEKITEYVFFPKKKFYLKIDMDTPYGKVVDVFQVLQKLGVRDVGLLVDGDVYPFPGVYSDFAGYQKRVKRDEAFARHGPLKY